MAVAGANAPVPNRWSCRPDAEESRAEDLQNAPLREELGACQVEVLVLHGNSPNRSLTAGVLAPSRVG